MSEEEENKNDQERFEELTWPAYKGIVESVEGFFQMITDEQLDELEGIIDRLGMTHFQLNWKGRIVEEKEHRAEKGDEKLH